jgi:uncharacterized protein YeeX (DUF496 family)
MKLSQLENNTVRTSCKNCVFATYRDNTQIGCLHDRIHSLKSMETENNCYVTEAYDDEKEFFVVNRFCNMYRDKIKWNNGIPDTIKAQDESKVTFNVIVDLGYLSEDYQKYIVNFIIHCEKYGINKVDFHFIHNNMLTKDQKHAAFKIASMVTGHKMSIYFNRPFLMHSSIIRSKKSFSIIITENNRVIQNILQAINNKINVDLKKVLLIKNNENFIFSNMSYKINCLQNAINDFDVILNNITQENHNEYCVEI